MRYKRVDQVGARNIFNSYMEIAKASLYRSPDVPNCVVAEDERFGIFGEAEDANAAVEDLQSALSAYFEIVLAGSEAVRDRNVDLAIDFISSGGMPTCLQGSHL